MSSKRSLGGRSSEDVPGTFAAFGAKFDRDEAGVRTGATDSYCFMRSNDRE